MKRIFILFVATATMMVGCDKDDKDPIVDAGCTAVKIVDLDEEYTTTLTYDNSGRLTQGKQTPNSGSGWSATSNFTYASGKITSTGYDNIEYTLDNQGRIISSKGIGDDAGYYNYTFTYDANGYLTKVTEDGVDIEKFTYTNGNLTKVENENGLIMLSYDLNKSNYQFETLISDYSSIFDLDNGDSFIYLYEMGYFGKKSKNRISSGTSDDNTATFVYEENSKGNVSKVTVKTSNNDDEYTDNISLEYSCK